MRTAFIFHAVGLLRIIIAPPERAKSTEALKFDEAGAGTYVLQKLTAWGLEQELSDMGEEQRSNVHHIVIPDFERISSLSKDVKRQVMAFVRTVTEEGMIRSRTYTSSIDFSKHPFKCAFIICTTDEDVEDGRSIYRKGTSLASRMVPFSYDYSENMKESVLKYVLDESSFEKDKMESLTGKEFQVDLPDRFKMSLKICAKYSARMTERWTNSNQGQLIGIRAEENLSAYMKAIALYAGRQRVTDEDEQEFL